MRFNPAPGWPPAPDGWTPPDGWQPDPSWPTAPVGWNYWTEDGSWPSSAGWEFRTESGSPQGRPSTSTVEQSRAWALDEAVCRLRPTTDGHWPARLAVLPTAAIVAVLLLELAISRYWHPSGAIRTVAFGVGSVLHYAAAAAAIWIIGQPVARRCGGWLAAFGWSAPHWRDLRLGLGATAGEYAVRFVGAFVLAITVPWLRGASADNVRLAGRTGAEIAILFVVAVLVAPPIEELIFRGLLLRTLLRRLPFWPAAAVSSACFAVLHLYEVNTPQAAVLLFVSILLFGLCQCLLVRWTARLAPAIVAHAASNAVGLLIALAVST